MMTSESPNAVPNKRKPLNRRLSFWITLLILVIVLYLIKQNNGLGQHHSHSGQPIPIVLAPVQSNDVPVYISALGTVTPTYNVTVKTQVNGTLLRVLFREGQFVKAGDLLAEIDSRPYEAQLLQYQGQLARDQALLNNAEIDLKRYQTLWHQDSVAQQTLATQQSLVKQYEGAVKADEGLLDSVKVNLFYCRITAPIDGRIGLRLVDAGNVVQTSDTTGLAVINTLDPITVIFSIPEDDVPKVAQQVNDGKILTVEALDREQNKLLATGTLLTVDNQIDPTTGTVKLKAQFDNKNSVLFPNQFVNVQLLVNTLHNAAIVPTAAIQYATTGPFVYLQNSDSTVSMKPIITGVTIGNNTSVTGVSPGQSVVVEGADKLTDGAKTTLSSALALSEKKHKRAFAL